MSNCFYLDKTYLIFGTGITGKAMISFCQKHNINFFVTDDNKENLQKIEIDEKFKLYDYNENILKDEKIDYLLLSPSIHAQNNPHRIVSLARQIGIEIIPDIDLFYCYIQQYNKKYKTNKKIICITGTNGKSTTTSLVAFLLNQFDKKAIACGNIGLNVLSFNIDNYDYFIVEMSSYNLYLSHYTVFDQSILLNITEDHLEYHGSMINYAKAKEKALLNSKYSIVCIDDEYTQQIAINHQNITKISTNDLLDTGFSWRNHLFYQDKNEIFNCEFANLPGKHNIENIFSSVVCVFNILKQENNNIKIDEIFEKVKLFQGLPHRIQFVKKINNIVFINDSKGTNADSTQKALQTYRDKNVYLIAGGQRKTAGFFALENDLKCVKHVFLIGQATDSFAGELDQLKIEYTKCDTMPNAVKIAYDFAKKDIAPNVIILLSPLCASWDQYKSFEERGEDFIKYVKLL